MNSGRRVDKTWFRECGSVNLLPLCNICTNNLQSKQKQRDFNELNEKKHTREEEEEATVMKRRRKGKAAATACFQQPPRHLCLHFQHHHTISPLLQTLIIIWLKLNSL